VEQLLKNTSPLRSVLLTGLALIAFAANSVLGRLVLGSGALDAASFTVVRLFSGSVALLLIISIKNRKKNNLSKGSWSSSFMLFVYALTFSYAYNFLDTATGALILFASVQMTMIVLSLVSGIRLHAFEWTGVVISFTGFVYLILPGVTAPPPLGFGLMVVAGMAWGIYTLKGRTSNNPLMDTAYNFFRTIPLVLILMVITVRDANYSTRGIALAVVSGALTSGIGYTIWYLALRNLSSTLAAVLQLLVPVIAAFGGVVFVSEKISSRLIISSALVLGGILLVIMAKKVFLQISSYSKS